MVQLMDRRVVVTGAFSYTGSAVARELIARGYRVHTLTNRQAPPGHNEVTSSPLKFDPTYLKNVLRDAHAFINTYWVRLPWRGQGFDAAVEKSRMIVQAAADANVGRLVHVSVSNASLGRNLGYYRGKDQVDDFVRSADISYAIVRPTLVVGANDVLTNNIAWFLRHFPIFVLPRAGDGMLRPITLADTARIIVDQIDRAENVDVDAAGPTRMTFKDYVGAIASACGVRRPLISAPNWLALGMLRLVGFLMRDVILTREELLGLQQELLDSKTEPLGSESVTDWLDAHGQQLGRNYCNDMRRHFGVDSHRPVLALKRISTWDLPL